MFDCFYSGINGSHKMRLITISIIFILILSVLALSLKERKQLLELDKRELVNIISDNNKVIEHQSKKIFKLNNKIQTLEIKKAFLKGRVFSMVSNKAIIITIIILIVIAGAVFVFIRYIR